MSKSTTQQQATAHTITLDRVLNELNYWRNNRKEFDTPGIPDPIWIKIFELAKTHGDKAIKQLFVLNSQQYKKKQEQLCEPEQTDPDSVTLEKKPAKVAPTIQLCEVTNELASKPTKTPSKTQSSPKTTPADIAKLKTPRHDISDFSNLSTVIVECIHADGHRLKIHATTASIAEVINEFYQLGAAC